MVRLVEYPVFHAGRRRLLHPDLGREIYSQTAVCYLRFLCKVKVDHLILPIENVSANSGRWVPSVPTHPAHLVVSLLDEKSCSWKAVKEVTFPRNAKFAGEGLTQDMPIEEMNEFFRKAVEEQPRHLIELGGLETDCLKVECDREYPVWPNHGEVNGGPFNVPFGLLRNLSAHGKELGKPSSPIYRRKLEKLLFAPSAPAGMKVGTKNPMELVFIGKKLSIGFSLIRPMITHLGWNCFGEENSLCSRLLFRGDAGNGPHYIAADGNYSSQNMTGKVSVEGNKVRYLDVETGCGIRINALFTVDAESVTMELEQDAVRDIPVIEGDAWRLFWKMRAGMTGVAGVPAAKEGRNGFVDLPALIAADEGGCLSVRLLEGQGAFFAESSREQELRYSGFVVARPDTADAPLVVQKGVSRAVFELRPCNLLPATERKEVSKGLRKSWAAGFSAFRPEFGGFSNNAISTNCHVNQWVAFDFAAFTAKAANGMDPVDLVKFSIGRALMDGGGYGYHRGLYMDSDPILLSGAGRIFQLTGDRKWIADVAPGISAAAQRIIGNFDRHEGMIVCRALSGNSGSFRWSSNAMDVVGFGHVDAYVNAWSFRAMKNAAALLRVAGNSPLSEKCADVASELSANYAKQLVNNETGWVSGWKSRDGRLHDFGFIWVNAVACAFGVMDRKDTRRALAGLETARRKLIPESGYLGLPHNLIPINESDHMLPRISRNYMLMPAFENYTDGALCPCMAGYYIRALASNGFKREAGKLAASLEQGFADGKFHGPIGTGREFMTWTGAESGYEGTFGPSSGPLYAIAVWRGIIRPPDPEWWPAA